MTERNTDMMNAAMAAVFTGLAVATLAKLRCLGGGPPYLKLGRKVVYRRADLADWLGARRVANTTQAALRLPRRLDASLNPSARDQRMTAAPRVRRRLKLRDTSAPPEPTNPIAAIPNTARNPEWRRPIPRSRPNRLCRH